MTDKERGDLVHKILRALKVAHAFKKERAAAHEEVAPFDEVDTFFRLAFMNEDALKHIAKEVGVL